MYSFEVTDWKQGDDETFDFGIYLWVIHADKIPPHIGISKNGFYFSLKVSGKDEAIPVKKVLHLLNSKAIPTLILKTSENSIKFKELNTVFDKYTQAGINDFTCLTPITEIYFSAPQDLILAELLNLLNEAGVLEEAHGFNLNADFKGILHYERKDIQNRLHHLNDVKRTKNIFEGH